MSPNKDPDEILAKKIIDKISDSGIVSEDELKKYLKLIERGEMSLQDWILITEPTGIDKNQ